MGDDCEAGPKKIDVNEAPGSRSNPSCFQALQASDSGEMASGHSQPILARSTTLGI